MQEFLEKVANDNFKQKLYLAKAKVKAKQEAKEKLVNKILSRPLRKK